ncbi:hypothetical protein [Thiolapillus sp.]
MKIPVAALLLLLLQAASAYEVETHARFSQKAATCSVLGDSAFMEALGLDGLEAEDPVWRRPVDIHDPKWIAKWNKEHGKVKYESTIKTLIGWGAKFEDEDERPLNHFFDPLNGKPLNPHPYPCPPGRVCRTSPDWSLEDGTPQPNLPNQRNSFFDANDHFFTALTASRENDRLLHWQTFFQTLGMVIHHVQDMAQPQHIRNDAHCDGEADGVDCYGFHNPSYYEKYTNARRAALLNSYSCTSYPRSDLKHFAKARDFWVTTPGANLGMAEFTNHNFVSAGTNFRKRGGVVADGDYPQPDPQNGGSGVRTTHFDIRTLLSDPTFALPGEMWFLGTDVTDSYLNTTLPNERASSYSLWDDKLEHYNASYIVNRKYRAFNLNRFNFEAGYEFLMPRAIAYSAGLIDYFFRGRMKVSENTYIGGDKIRITVTNTTAEENPGGAPFTFTGTSARPGKFYLYQDQADGTRWELEAVNEEEVSLTSSEKFNAGDKRVLEFRIPANMDFALDKPLTLVFDGRIGAPDLQPDAMERGIAVHVFSLSRLLAFDISRAGAGAAVPNIVDIYQSQDSGASWQPVASSGIEIPVSDSTPDPGDRLAVQAAFYLRDGVILVYPDYLDFGGSSYSIGVAGFRLEQFGQSLASPLSLDFSTLLAGGENFADWGAALRSLTYTGGHSLAALRVRHPDSGAPPPRIRTFGLLQISDWMADTAWEFRPGWGEGGLPELSWLGGDRYAMSAYVECIEQNPPCSPRNNKFGSALRATDDAGATYRDLASLSGECTQQDFFCIQFIRPLDNGRLLGWVTRRGTVDPGPVTLYQSIDGGASWSVYGAVPMPAACVGIDYPYVVVEDIVYLGSGNTTTGQPVRDSLFIQATCNRITTDNSGQVFLGFEEIGRSAFATVDSGASWAENPPPPVNNGRVIFAGDNGVVPGLQGP